MSCLLASWVVLLFITIPSKLIRHWPVDDTSQSFSRKVQWIFCVNNKLNATIFYSAENSIENQNKHKTRRRENLRVFLISTARLEYLIIPICLLKFQALRARVNEFPGVIGRMCPLSQTITIWIIICDRAQGNIVDYKAGTVSFVFSFSLLPRL